MTEFDEISEKLGLSPETDSNNNSDTNLKTKRNSDKYSLRPRSFKKLGNEEEIITFPKKRTKSDKSPKPKQRPAPLSKYRRKTANARERDRMKEINQAFETLRNVVPQMPINPQANEKLTKITTLRLAIKYIATLSSVLDQYTPIHPQDNFSEMDCFLAESDGESSQPVNSDFSDNSLTPADFSMDFPEDSLASVDFSPLSPDFSYHMNQFDLFFSDFS